MPPRAKKKQTRHRLGLTLKALKPDIELLVHLLGGQILMDRTQAHLLISTTNLSDFCPVRTFRDIAHLPSGITCPVRLLVLIVHNLFLSKRLRKPLYTLFVKSNHVTFALLCVSPGPAYMLPPHFVP